MTVHFIGAGPGAADLMTLRGRDLLAACPVCLYAGSIVSADMLAYCPPGAKIVNTAQLSLDQIIEECAIAHAQGQDVARLHSGDPALWSAMAEQMRRLRALKIPCDVTPGVPAFAAASAALNAELTLPGVAQSVILTRTPGRASAMPAGENLAAFAATKATLALHLSIHALDRVLRELIPHYGADCPIALVWRASWPDQKIVRATLGTLDASVGQRMERTAIILVGWALDAQNFDDSRLYAEDYDRRFRPRGASPRFPEVLRATQDLAPDPDPDKNAIEKPAGRPPALLIAAPASGAGKTTLTLGLLAALRARGIVVQPFKCGPDYIDPAFHRAASGRPSFNLDSWAMGAAQIQKLADKAQDADMILAEASMGLFDGVAAPGEAGVGASADIAALMGWPVVLAIDASGQAQSAGAVARGFATTAPNVKIIGAVLNRIASPRHEALARLGLSEAGIKCFGALPRRPALHVPSRHLGLVQAQEQDGLEALLREMGDFVGEHVDIDGLISEARARIAPPVNPKTFAPKTPIPPGQKIALAQDSAFSFVYPHILEEWRSQGAEIAPFSPLADEAPAEDADICWLPGGYPELHAGVLSAARNFKQGLRRFAREKPVHGECGGYMAMGAALIDAQGVRHEMAGLLGLVSSFAKPRMRLGYRLARLLGPMPGFAPGDVLRGHEFHYAGVVARDDEPLAEVFDASGAAVLETGSRRGGVTGTFFHLIAPARNA